ncbi:uncharacterized, partial [Tachysurus ichikawai]
PGSLKKKKKPIAKQNSNCYKVSQPAAQNNSHGLIGPGKDVSTAETIRVLLVDLELGSTAVPPAAEEALS